MLSMSVINLASAENEQSQQTKIGLHQKINAEMFLKLKKFFSNRDNEISKEEFRRRLKIICGLTFDDAAFNVLYMKIDSERRGDSVTWSEVLSHLILGFQEEHDASKSTSIGIGARLEPPITGFPKVFKSHHRHPIIRITYFPEMSHNRVVNHLYGSYITCSKDGVINYWSIDMKLRRTAYSTCPELRVQPTWVTDLVCLPDVSVVCTSSAERDLRFYDTTAQKFELRVMISSLPNAVCTMSYSFYDDVNKKCKLILGDMKGIVKIIEFIPKDRGPFKSKPGVPLTTVRWEQFLKGAIPSMTVKEFYPHHMEWVRQVAFYEKLGCLISIAPCSKYSMILHNMTEKESNYIFKVQKGFWCFAFEEEASHLIATGGPDCLIRVWNPFVPKRAVAVFRGHHGGIVSIILQGKGTILCSISQDKCVRVWDIMGQTCMQVYMNLPQTLGERINFSTYYNPSSRQVFMAGMQIAEFQIYPLLNDDYTDGFTHSKDISVVLFNTLFKVVITCGHDSFIIIWDPFTGRRMRIVRDAHSISIDGILAPIAITAATFDPANQLLITGARDGTLKVWNFNTGTCMRNMNLGRPCFITSIVWLKLRILVMGENRCVAEFTDCNDVGASNFKSWSSRHKHDILASASRPPQTLVTGSYTGELIFWRLETGTAYGMYSVINPTERITLQYEAIHKKKDESKLYPKQSISSYIPIKSKLSVSKTTNKSVVLQRKTNRSMELCKFPTYAIQSILFLTTRPMHSRTATVLVAIATGYVQLWSHNSGGIYLESFNAVHNQSDYVVSMITDKDDKYLITGHYAGYIKIWLMENYGLPKETEIKICMPLLRLKFPFMWGDTIVGRAQKSRKNEPPLPILLSSFRGHYLPVTGLAYLDESQIIVSSDGTARMWTLSGRYLCLLGSFKPFEPLIPDVPPDPDRNYVLPADIKRFCSSTTLRVLSGGMLKKRLTRKQIAKRANKEPKVIEGVYGSRIPLDSILGHVFQLPPKTKQPVPLKLDTMLRQIPIYKEFLLQEPQEKTSIATADEIKKDAKDFKRRQSR